jgi:hypothetical protein
VVSVSAGTGVATKRRTERRPHTASIADIGAGVSFAG